MLNETTKHQEIHDLAALFFDGEITITEYRNGLVRVLCESNEADLIAINSDFIAAAAR